MALNLAITIEPAVCRGYVAVLLYKHRHDECDMRGEKKLTVWHPPARIETRPRFDPEADMNPTYALPPRPLPVSSQDIAPAGWRISR